MYYCSRHRHDLGDSLVTSPMVIKGFFSFFSSFLAREGIGFRGALDRIKSDQNQEPQGCTGARDSL